MTADSSSATPNFDLLSEVVDRARTNGGVVIIPTDLFDRIQARVREVEEARRDAPRKVESILVTAPDDGRVMEFWMPFCGVLNTQSKQRETTHFTVWNDPPVMDALTEAAQRVGVGLQRITGAGESEGYETLHDAGVGLWTVESRRAGAAGAVRRVT